LGTAIAGSSETVRYFFQQMILLVYRHLLLYTLYKNGYFFLNGKKRLYEGHPSFLTRGLYVPAFSSTSPL
jgi:hypothetical protein